MCMPYLGKLFSGGHRRRNNGAATPRPSLAPTPQQSNATMRTSNTNNNNMDVNQKRSISPVNVGFSGLASDAPASIRHGSVGAEALPHQTSTPTTSIAGTGIEIGAATATATDTATVSTTRPTSWWEFFGINRSKKIAAGMPTTFK